MINFKIKILLPSLIFIVLFGFFLKNKKETKIKYRAKNNYSDKISKSIDYETQLEIFSSLGYHFNKGVTKELILTDGYDKSMWNEIIKKRLKEIEENPFSVLYHLYGWRSPETPSYNFSNKCILFDLEFIDPSDQYIWFMERMGVITDGEIRYTDISIEIDENRYEWIIFKVNDIRKKWKLEKVGYISDSFFQRFSHLTNELKTKGNYTYYDNESQQFVIDYATESEQKEFIEKTGLKREWLGEGNHFNEPK